MSVGRQGFTLIELLIALSVIAVLMAAGAASLRAPVAQVYAENVKTLLLQSRFEAIRQSQPVVVSWNAAAGRFEAFLGDLDAPCDLPSSGVPLLRTDAAEVGRIDVSITGEGSLVWVPSGQARTCGGLVFTEVVATINDSRVTRQVVVSFGGRVEVN